MLKVGGEVDAFCTRCQLSLAHTVHAIVGGKPVKVECNTCHTVHRYRNGAWGTSSPARGNARPARRSDPTPAASFDALLATKRTAEARPYSPKATFAVDDVVDHPLFGRGFVSAIRDGGKIEVAFRSDVKLLVHGR